MKEEKEGMEEGKKRYRRKAGRIEVGNRGREGRGSREREMNGTRKE